jgi:hypothetical protein
VHALDDALGPKPAANVANEAEEENAQVMDMTSLRDQTREAFEAKAMDGSLIELLGAGTGPATGSTMASDKAEVEVADAVIDIDALRERTRESLEKGANDGSLLEIMPPQAPPEDINAQTPQVDLGPRLENVRQLLEAGAMDGRLQELLGIKHEEESKPAEKAPAIEVDAAKSGNLERALSKEPPPQQIAGKTPEEMRSMARDIIGTAAGDGTLESILKAEAKTRSDVHSSQMDVSHLKETVSVGLVDAAKSGNLERALSKEPPVEGKPPAEVRDLAKKYPGNSCCRRHFNGCHGCQGPICRDPARPSRCWSPEGNHVSGIGRCRQER